MFIFYPANYNRFIPNFYSDINGKVTIEKGAEIITTPEGFLVEETEGPLVEGEQERAAAWMKGLQ